MGTEALAAGIKELRPFVPARDFDKSLAFYEALGFTSQRLGPDLAEMRMGAHSFLLQNYHVPAYAENFVMHMIVDDVDAWWAHIVSMKIEDTYGTTWKPRAPALQTWGLIVAFVADPSGVLWHFAQRPKPA